MAVRRSVSMKSGLRDRNNVIATGRLEVREYVSMKSGLRDRNNPCWLAHPDLTNQLVSMKSGLRDRNNYATERDGLRS